MAQLIKALQDQDLKMALDKYLYLRRRTLPPELVQPWFHAQRKLIQLFHRNRLEKSSSNLADRWIRQLEQLEQHRERVLRHIAERTLKHKEHAEPMTALVDAIGKSKAMMQYSYSTGSKTKLHDWRGALRVLEDWSVVYMPQCKTANTAAEEATEPVVPKTISQATSIWGSKSLEQDLATWLTKVMKALVNSHTYLIRSMLDTLPQLFGIQATVGMHVVLMRYYAMLGQEGCQDVFTIVERMNNQSVQWKLEPEVYDYILYSLSHMSGNEAQADRVIAQMLANNLIPRQVTMKAAILCAARSGDLQACSRYISRMHQEWNLTITERMKAILLYACAKRGDFDGALEILGQLSHSGTLVHSQQDPLLNRDSKKMEHNTTMPKTISNMEEILSTQDIVNNSNLLLAIINETHTKRNGKQLTQEFVKEEVSKVLNLFTVITKNRAQVDTQLYTIMMQYLSTLPSPLPAMMYLYKEMIASVNAKPNNVTYRIMLEACADQIDMDRGKQLWMDLSRANIPKDCYVRASYVKGWGRMGNLKQAERFALEGLEAQAVLDRERLQRQMAITAGHTERHATGVSDLSTKASRPAAKKHWQKYDMIDLSVLHELMRANRAHNQPERVYQIYQEIEAGKWGTRIQPNQLSLSLVLQACSSSASSTLVDQAIELVERYLAAQRLHQREQMEGSRYVLGGNDQSLSVMGQDEDDSAEDMGGVFQSEPATKKGPILSDINYQLYYTMLGRHHRQRKIVAVWNDMMDSIERPPSQLTVNLAIEALENVQWGAAPIKHIQRQLREHWPEIEWTGGARNDRSGARSDGPGGRFWK
ncbi:hypothetical protein BGZ51_007772 [Haplosporangium sp. Z 767]|nr:hypothetical protein BGZ51_007772 [Haplosporangium sp. Z 767]